MTFIEKLGTILGLPVLFVIIIANMFAVPYAIITGIMKLTENLDFTWVQVFLPMIIVASVVVLVGLVTVAVLIYVVVSDS